MDEDITVPVSPRHSVRLAREYVTIVRKAQRRDFVVRTITKRQAGGVPLMTAEIVIAGEETREQFPLAQKYPLHFRKTYFPGRLHGDPKDEFDRQARASSLIDIPPPIGHSPTVFRTCLLPGQSYSMLSPFQSEPMEANIPKARELGLATAAGLWLLAERAVKDLTTLHAAGLAHGDAELHNFIVCPSPVEIVPIDFEGALERGELSDEDWAYRVNRDLEPLLRHAVLLEVSLGAQAGPLAELAEARMPALFKDPDRFHREIERRSDLD
ncbi:MAG TPA: hypothetical protein VMI54_24120 [Polyangiaceae bacterium]|nr:hypothetical protein [Polyangiaceae bacterium]